MQNPNDNGIVIGVVKHLDDPEGIGRVRAELPHLNNQLSDWAKVAAPMAGKDRGAFFRPEKDDEVLIAFGHGEARVPYVIGALWSTVDTPPADDGKTASDGTTPANNWRFFKSRSGHVIKLDDTQGAEKIELIDKDKKRRVVIDSANSKIQVICDQGDVEVQAKAGSVKVEATTVEIKASGNMTLEATGTMTVKGATVNIN
jgi:uncharacterized protein involved in type VI secretion and phage assembly